MKSAIAPAVIRGEVIDTDLIEYAGRDDIMTFATPDPAKLVGKLTLSSPSRLADLYELSFDDILDYLEELAGRLDISTNEHLQRAREFTYRASHLTPPLVDAMYGGFAGLLARDTVRQIAESTVGIEYLEGWVDHRIKNGPRIRVRAFGSRGLHIIAGNGPGLAVLSLVRSAITRSDCIIKVPSNDPFTSAALGMTMCEMAPDHPITRHYACMYWQGGDATVEDQIYQPRYLEKITAWGGFAGVKHVTKYVQPGLELISLDPKNSISVVGPEALADAESMREAAYRIAVDTAGGNQMGCASSRVVYVLTGTWDDGIERVNQLGRLVYEQMGNLPPTCSTKPKSYDRELKSHVEALLLDDDWFKVIGCEQDEGGVIVSQLPRRVDFSAYLQDRTSNLVPVGSIDEVLLGIDAYTQTIGVWPESLKAELENVVPLYGAQRLVTLGNALYPGPLLSMAHDAIEPVRRMCKWVVNEVSEGVWDAPPIS